MISEWRLCVHTQSFQPSDHFCEKRMASKSSLPEEFLTCPVCFDFFKDPVIVLCNHSICKDCLQMLWRRRNLKRVQFVEENLQWTIHHWICLRSTVRDLNCSVWRIDSPYVCQASRKNSGDQFLPIDEAALNYKVSFYYLLIGGNVIDDYAMGILCLLYLWCYWMSIHHNRKWV